MLAICETEECGNYMYSCPLPPDYGAVVCGVCGHEITTITDTAPELPTEVPEWLS